MTYFLIGLITAIVCFITIFAIVYAATTLAINRKKFKIVADKNRDEIRIEPIVESRHQKAEFIEDATQEELDEMEQAPEWKRFLNKFIKIR